MGNRKFLIAFGTAKSVKVQKVLDSEAKALEECSTSCDDELKFKAYATRGTSTSTRQKRESLAASVSRLKPTEQTARIAALSTSISTSTTNKDGRA